MGSLRQTLAVDACAWTREAGGGGQRALNGVGDQHMPTAPFPGANWAVEGAGLQLFLFIIIHHHEGVQGNIR